ncbi:hypothetical protein BG011_009218 [Mortierella polycephala]|uniref:C2H2-type domain-containing protein n=1 Tax=Mortierella polycephala TaxID=41804 RepID=A0A9P6PPL7_9FUNG|nr:hypothetical protein BG011_009218 [Mortierella polycephala]
MDSTPRFMDTASINLSIELCLFDDDCTQSVFPSSAIQSTSTNGNVFNYVADEQIMNNTGYTFPSALATVPWDITSSKQEQHFGNFLPVSNIDFTPELSPSMGYSTPAMNTNKSPFAFDTLGLDELGASPMVGWQSPLDEPFGSQQSQESSDFDLAMDVNQNSFMSAQRDFQLFPDNAPSVSSLEQLLMTPVPTENDLPMIEESPIESDLDCFTPMDSAATSPAMSDYSELFGTPFISGTPSKYKPPRRLRRRRMTSEEAARIIPDESKDDPEAKPRFKCEICNKTFSRPFNLRSHRTTHAGIKPFTCTYANELGNVCDWSFARRHDLERHMRSRHSTEKLFKCKTCGTECGRNDAFKRHLQRHAACGLAALQEQQNQGINLENRR